MYLYIHIHIYIYISVRLGGYSKNQYATDRGHHLACIYQRLIRHFCNIGLHLKGDINRGKQLDENMSSLGFLVSYHPMQNFFPELSCFAFHSLHPLHSSSLVATTGLP